MATKHIIWDWNGTLLDDRWFCIETMNGVLRRRDMKEMTEKWFLENFTFPVKDYYIKLGFDFDKEPFSVSGSEFIHDYKQHHHEPNLHSQSVKVLEFFKDRGLTQSLLSAASQDMLDDILGREVIVLVNEEQNYGYKKLAWNGKDQSGNLVAPGIYFYRAVMGPLTETKKMVLLK